MPITYRTGNDLDLDGVVDLYRSCSLGIRRPLDHRDRVRRMIEQANLVISAWDGGLMVGIARGLTDFSYCTYLSDLAVRESHQRSGIGRELLRLIREAGGPDAQLILLSAPDAVDYYPHLGFIRHESAWVWPREV